MLVVIACAKFAVSMSKNQLNINQDNRVCLFGNNEISTLKIQIKQGHLSIDMLMQYVVLDNNYHVILSDSDKFKGILKNFKTKSTDLVLTTIIGLQKVRAEIVLNDRSMQLLVISIIIIIVFGLWCFFFCLYQWVKTKNNSR